jgi:hypothetical protein
MAENRGSIDRKIMAAYQRMALKRQCISAQAKPTKASRSRDAACAQNKPVAMAARQCQRCENQSGEITGIGGGGDIHRALRGLRASLARAIAALAQQRRHGAG